MNVLSYGRPTFRVLLLFVLDLHFGLNFVGRKPHFGECAQPVSWHRSAESHIPSNDRLARVKISLFTDYGVEESKLPRTLTRANSKKEVSPFENVTTFLMKRRIASIFVAGFVLVIWRSTSSILSRGRGLMCFLTLVVEPQGSPRTDHLSYIRLGELTCL